MRNQLFRFILPLTLLNLGLTACGAQQSAQTSDFSNASSSVGGGTTTTPAKPTPTPTPVDESNSWGICGSLNFNGVVFPASLKNEEAKAMALSLSVSGSFEGQAGWSNLAGNFDGMGVSMGLLQQNFGTGSLQPLLLKLENVSPSTLTSNLTTADLKSLESMLSTYQAATGIKISEFDESPTDLFPDVEALSPLDTGYVDPSTLMQIKSLNTAETASVKWATTNVLSSTSVFVPRWKTSLTAIATSAPYRTIQVGAALSMFTKALGYFDAFGFTQMSSLLLMYDFVVQDGGFTAAQKASFAAWVKANPSSTETARAKELLTIRLVAVNPTYRADVQVRKLTIINGTGTVHGTARNLPKEFCYTASEKI